MRRILSSLIAMCLTLALLAGGAFIWGYQQYSKAGPLKETTLLMVDKGSGVSLIAAKLASESVIEYPLLFKIAARLKGVDKHLKAGEYEFETGISIAGVLYKLSQGLIFERLVTIPEGLTSWQIVQLLNKEEALDGDVNEIPKEGSLLPETYYYTKGETRAEKIGQMQKAMQETLDELWNANTDKASMFSKAEVIILASIVEKETAVPGERKRIAGVFINRLKKGIKLQTDPTVIYAITNGKIEDKGWGPLGRRLLTKDLKFDSPYNTYKYAGLPPGPIANPGRASIEAVLNPEQHDYYYFVADGTGGHVFAKTLAEHNKNVARWRKIRAQGR